eukprot:468828_1
MSFIKLDASMDCNGAHSCFHTSITMDNHPIHCGGLHSCSYSNITSNHSANAVYCDGYASCAHSYINTIDTMYAKGAYSLYGAHVVINNLANIFADGEFATYGAEIFCRAGNICYIYCRARYSCYGLYIDCSGDCRITHESDDIAPITNRMTFDNFEICDLDLLVDHNERLCNMSTAITFDDKQEQNGGPSIIMGYSSWNGAAPLCCRGAGACQAIDSIEYLPTTPHNIAICSGSDGCAHSSFDMNNGTIFCEGETSCSSAEITNASRVSCVGSYSCTDSTIIHARRIECSAHYSCQRASIYSAGSDLNVYFNSYKAGSLSVVHCNETDSCTITCSTPNACSNTELYCRGSCSVTCGPSFDCVMEQTGSYFTQYTFQFDANETPIICPIPEYRTTLDPTQDPTAAPLSSTSTNQPTETSIATSITSTSSTASITTSSTTSITDVIVTTTDYPNGMITSDHEEVLDSLDDTDMPNDSASDASSLYDEPLLLVIGLVIFFGFVACGCFICSQWKQRKLKYIIEQQDVYITKMSIEDDPVGVVSDAKSVTKNDNNTNNAALSIEPGGMNSNEIQIERAGNDGGDTDQSEGVNHHRNEGDVETKETNGKDVKDHVVYNMDAEQDEEVVGEDQVTTGGNVDLGMLVNNMN